METVIALLLIVTISYLSSRFSPVLVRLPVGAQHILFTGTEYLFLGLLLGPHFIGFLSEDTLSQLQPFVSLALGWIGLLYGLQFNWKDVTAFPLNYLLIAFLQALITMVAVSIVFYPLIGYLMEEEKVFFYPLLLALATSASLTSPSAIAVLHRRIDTKGKGKVITLIRYISSIDSLLGITLFGSIFALFHVTGGDSQGLLPYGWFAIMVGTAFTLALIFYLLLLFTLTSNELLTVTIGMVVFSSGIAAFLYLSPLLVNMIIGLILANISSKREILYESLVRAERPFYTIFVIIAGGLWTVDLWWGIAGALVYIAARMIGKYLGGKCSAALLKPAFVTPKRLGLALLSQGGVAIAIAINLQQTYQTSLTDTVVTIILLGVIINEVLGPTYLLRVMEKGDG